MRYNIKSYRPFIITLGLICLGAASSTMASDYCPTHDNGKAIKYPENQCDVFRLSDPNHALHVLGEFSIQTGGYMIARKLGASKFDSWLVPFVVGFVAGAVKEVVFDEFTSGGNIVGNTVGLVAGSLFVWSFNF